MSAITAFSKFISSSFTDMAEENKSEMAPLLSLVNTNGIPIDLFVVKHEYDFTKDKNLFLKAYPGFESQKMKCFENGSEYLDYFFGNVGKNIKNQNGYYIRAYNNKELVGCAYFDLNWKKNDPVLEKCIYLEQIFIDPNFQKTGIGKKLLFSCLSDSEVASRFDSIVALVERYLVNSPREFYKKLGFKIIDQSSLNFSVQGSLYKYTA